MSGSDPLGAGNGAFKDSENCLGIDGGPVALPCVASSVAVTLSATRWRPRGDFTLTTPVKTSLPVRRDGGLRREGEMVARSAGLDLAGEPGAAWQDVNGVDFIRRVSLLRKHSNRSLKSHSINNRIRCLCPEARSSIRQPLSRPREHLRQRLRFSIVLRQGRDRLFVVPPSGGLCHLRPPPEGGTTNNYRLSRFISSARYSHARMVRASMVSVGF